MLATIQYAAMFAAAGQAGATQIPNSSQLTMSIPPLAALSRMLPPGAFTPNPSHRSPTPTVGPPLAPPDRPGNALSVQKSLGTSRKPFRFMKARFQQAAPSPVYNARLAPCAAEDRPVVLKLRPRR